MTASESHRSPSAEGTGMSEQNKRVVVDLDELDSLIRQATNGQHGTADALPKLVTAIGSSTVHAATTDDAISLLARLLLHKLYPERHALYANEIAYAEQMVAQDLTGALALACGSFPPDVAADRAADLRTRRERRHYLPGATV